MIPKTYMKQRHALRIYIQDGSHAKREMPVHFVVVACCTEFKDGRFVVDDLRAVSKYVQPNYSGVNGD